MFDELDKREKAVEAEKRTRLAYKRMFLNDEEGKLVLLDMLWNLKFLTPCRTEGDMALCNYAKELLALVYGDPNGKIENHRLANVIKPLTKKIKKIEGENKKWWKKITQLLWPS